MLMTTFVYLFSVFFFGLYPAVYFSAMFPRECNRLVARKTRVKKKIELDLLQNSFNDYRCSNDSLRTMLKAVVTREISSHILLDCNFQLPNNVVAIVAEMIAARECQQYITSGQVDPSLRSFCITNPTVFDNPIAYASQDFGELTGYDTLSLSTASMSIGILNPIALP